MPSQMKALTGSAIVKDLNAVTIGWSAMYGILLWFICIDTTLCIVYQVCALTQSWYCRNYSPVAMVSKTFD